MNFFVFFINTPRSAAAQWMAVKSLFLTPGQQVRNLASFSTSFKFEPPAFENAAQYPNSKTQHCYAAKLVLCPRQVW